MPESKENNNVMCSCSLQDCMELSVKNPARMAICEDPMLNEGFKTSDGICVFHLMSPFTYMYVSECR